MPEYTQIYMYLPTLEHIPPLPALPEGYTLRSFRAGDEAGWESIIRDAFEDQKWNFATMRDDPYYNPDHILFITYRGQPVATASAWYREEYGEDCGYLHMVGCHSAHRGLRLGYIISLAALHSLKEQERIGVILSTDDFRLPAIKSYLRLGFQVQMKDPSIPRRWLEIMRRIESDARS